MNVSDYFFFVDLSLPFVVHCVDSRFSIISISIAQNEPLLWPDQLFVLLPRTDEERCVDAMRSVLIFVVCLSSFISGSFGALCVWTNALGTGLWRSAPNWSCGSVPVTGDTARINTTSAAVVTLSGASLTVGTLELGSGATIIINSQLQVNGVCRVLDRSSVTIIAYNSMIFSSTVSPSLDLTPGGTMNVTLGGSNGALTMTKTMAGELGTFILHSIQSSGTFTCGQTGWNIIAMVVLSASPGNSLTWISNSGVDWSPNRISTLGTINIQCALSGCGLAPKYGMKIGAGMVTVNTNMEINQLFYVNGSSASPAALNRIRFEVTPISVMPIVSDDVTLLGPIAGKSLTVAFAAATSSPVGSFYLPFKEIAGSLTLDCDVAYTLVLDITTQVGSGVTFKPSGSSPPCYISGLVAIASGSTLSLNSEIRYANARINYTTTGFGTGTLNLGNYATSWAGTGGTLSFVPTGTGVLNVIRSSSTAIFHGANNALNLLGGVSFVSGNTNANAVIYIHTGWSSIRKFLRSLRSCRLTDCNTQHQN